MARKKIRPAHSAGPATAATETPANSIQAGPTPNLTPSSAIKPDATLPAATPSLPPGKLQPDPWLAGMWKMVDILGSLQLAVPLLGLFAGMVLLATLMEHWYSTKIAQELCYKSWWFVLLLLLLSVSIFFAAVKKMQWRKPEDFDPPTRSEIIGQAVSFGAVGVAVAYLPSWWPWSSPPYDWSLTPAAILAMLLFGAAFAGLGLFFCYNPHLWPWKRSQTGFLVTHIGLLTMLFGGVLNALYGTDAQMQLIDTRDPEIHARVRQVFGTIPQSSKEVIYSDIAMLQVTEAVGRGESQIVGEGDFWGGALPWKTTPGIEVKGDAFLSIMNWLQHPLGRNWSLNLKNGGTLEVIDYLPLARREEFSPAQRSGIPAFKVQLQSRSKFINRPIETWLATTVKNHLFESNPIRLEFLGLCPMALVEEFRNPPRQDELGKKGVLAAAIAGEIYRIPVDGNLDNFVPLGNSGWRVRLVKYDPAPGWDHGGAPTNPLLEFELYQGNRREGRLKMLARFPANPLDAEEDGAYPHGAGGRPWFWYHGPDVRRGNEGTKGVLQFIESTGEKLYYRSFSSLPAGGFGVESSGAVKVGSSYPIWPKMKWSFRVPEYLPRAEEKVRFLPLAVAPGKDTDDDRMRHPSAVLCRLTMPGQDKAREFWVQQGQGSQAVEIGGRRLRVSYSLKFKDLGFEILLERAEQTVDPGTRAPASFSSYIRLYDKELGINGERREITMNVPLEHRRYKFYQSSYNFLDAWDASGKPVSLSGFTVSFDPGLELKYTGSILLSLGIFMMFYMKAYFFKHPGRRKPG